MSWTLFWQLLILILISGLMASVVKATKPG